MTKYYSAQKVSVVIFPVLRYRLSSDLQNYFRSRCTGLYVGLYAQHSATIKKNTPKPWPTRWKSHQTKACLPSHPSRASLQLYMRLAKGLAKIGRSRVQG